MRVARARLSATNEAGVSITLAIVLAACGVARPPASVEPSPSTEAPRRSGSILVPSPSTKDETTSPGRPALELSSISPQPGLSGRIAFDDNADVYVVDLPTGRITRLTNDPAPERNAVWSPNGESIAYRSGQDGRNDIFVMNSDGTDKRNVTRTKDRDEWGPTWSPDGGWLALNAPRPGPTDPLQIHIVRPDGTDGHFLDTAYAEFPAWSPDGTVFAFASLRPGATGLNPDYDIHTVNVDGTGEQNVTVTPLVMESNPQWSPDGSRIAFMASPVGNASTRIWTMRPDGTDMRDLSDPWTAVPAWSPDGAFIAYLEVHADDGEIKIMKPDGTGVVTLGLSAPGLGSMSWTR